MGTSKDPHALYAAQDLAFSDTYHLWKKLVKSGNDHPYLTDVELSLSPYLQILRHASGVHIPKSMGVLRDYYDALLALFGENLQGCYMTLHYDKAGDVLVFAKPEHHHDHPVCRETAEMTKHYQRKFRLCVKKDEPIDRKAFDDLWSCLSGYIAMVVAAKTGRIQVKRRSKINPQKQKEGAAVTVYQNSILLSEAKGIAETEALRLAKDIALSPPSQPHKPPTHIDFREIEYLLEQVDGIDAGEAMDACRELFDRLVSNFKSHENSCVEVVYSVSGKFKQVEMFGLVSDTQSTRDALFDIEWQRVEFYKAMACLPDKNDADLQALWLHLSGLVTLTAASVARRVTMTRQSLYGVWRTISNPYPNEDQSSKE